MGHGTEEAEREGIVDVITPQCASGHVEKLVQVVPMTVGTVELDIGETVRRFEGFDACSPLKRHTEQAQCIVDQRTGLHHNRAWGEKW